MCIRIIARKDPYLGIHRSIILAIHKKLPFYDCRQRKSSICWVEFLLFCRQRTSTTCSSTEYQYSAAAICTPDSVYIYIISSSNDYPGEIVLCRPVRTSSPAIPHVIPRISSSSYQSIKHSTLPPRPDVPQLQGSPLRANQHLVQVRRGVRQRRGHEPSFKRSVACCGAPLALALVPLLPLLGACASIWPVLEAPSL